MPANLVPAWAPAEREWLVPPAVLLQLLAVPVPVPVPLPVPVPVPVPVLAV